jgi:hypothetical protein
MRTTTFTLRRNLGRPHSAYYDSYLLAIPSFAYCGGDCVGDCRDCVGLLVAESVMLLVGSDDVPLAKRVIVDKMAGDLGKNP